MPQGKSGRIVIDVEPEFKRDLHNSVRALGYDSLKDWFVEQARQVCEESRQPSLGLAAEDRAPYPNR